jgi:putative component of toxin-antitoxin plasmid stabilization module
MLEIRKTNVYAKWIDEMDDLRGREVVILLARGDKATQASDIKKAIKLAQNI